MKSYSLDQAQDLLIGKTGTLRRDQFEFELKLRLVGDMIKAARQERRLTQEQLGKLIGVQRSQISKLENNAEKVTIATIMKAFEALKANVNFQIELSNCKVNIA